MWFLNNNNSSVRIETLQKRKGRTDEWHWDKFTEEVCPIPVKDFAHFENIPQEIVNDGFDAIKAHLKDNQAFGTSNYISFVGLPSKIT